jgi:hypothetical protein
MCNFYNKIINNNINILILLLLLILTSCNKKNNYKTAVSSINKMPEYTKLNKICKKYEAQHNKKFKVQLKTDKNYLFTTNFKLLKDSSYDMAVISNSDYSTKDTNEKEISNIKSVIPINSRIFYIAYNKNKIIPQNMQDLFENHNVTILSNETVFIKKILSDFGVNISKVNFLMSKIHINNLENSNLNSNILDSLSKIDFFNSYKTNKDLPYDIEVGFTSQNFSSTGRLNKLLNSHLELELFSLDDFRLFRNGSKAEGFCLRNKFFTPFLLPKGSFGEYPESPILTIREDFILAAKDDVDDEFIYDFVKTAIEETDLIDMTIYGENFNNINFTFPLHEGTRRYFDKNSPKFFEKYGEMIGKFGAGVGGLYTAFMGFILWRKKRRRRSIIIVFEKVLEMQAKLNSEISTDELEQMYNELQNIQQEYHLKMISHKILVDDTLQIFFVMIDKIEGYILEELNKRK